MFLNLKIRMLDRFYVIKLYVGPYKFCEVSYCFLKKGIRNKLFLTLLEG